MRLKIPQKCTLMSLALPWQSIIKIWQQNIPSNTVSIRQDTFLIGDEIKYKPWSSSPEACDSWVYISKGQKGCVTDVGQHYVTCDFEADTCYNCAIHEIENTSTKKANYSGFKNVGTKHKHQYVLSLNYIQHSKIMSSDHH